MKGHRAGLLVVVVLLAACGGSGGAASSDTADGEAEVAEQGARSSAVDEVSGFAADSAEKPAPAPADGDRGDVAAASGSGGTGTTGAGGGGGRGQIDAPKLDRLPDASLRNERIIKEGTISIEVADNKFDSAFQRVITTARTLGGDVIGSSTRTNDDGDTFGSVTVRVPVEDFEDLLVDMSGIGTIRNRDINSQDVSAEYTDLESRLRHLEALERFYLGLFDDAEDVSDAITVQEKLQSVQGQIEKAQGRLNLLDDRTSFSTLTVEIFEPGVGEKIVEEEEAGDRPTLARYWQTARDAFVNVVGALLVALFFVLPLLVPLTLLGALGLALMRRRRSAPVAKPVQPEGREPVGADR